MSRAILVKLGGSALKDLDLVKSLCEDLAFMHATGISMVLVHGGGPSISDELALNGIYSNFIDGQRVTTPEMMDIIEMVLAGKINGRIVRMLNAAGADAVGLSGTDGKLLRCRMADPKLQQVGAIENVTTSVLTPYLNVRKGKPAIPVIAPVGIDSNGNALNINADWAASRIAQALHLKKVIYLTDQEGILDGQGRVFSDLNESELQELIDKTVVKGGMLTKVKTILHGLKNGISYFHILNSTRPHSLIEHLLTHKRMGTVCRSQDWKQAAS